MSSRHRYPLLACAVIASTLSALSPMTPNVSGQSASKAAGSANAAPPVDGGWPRVSTTASGAALVIYQPQIASWVDQKDLVFYAAISYTPAGAKAALGTIKGESATSVSTAQRLVSLAEVRITDSNFSTLTRDQLRTVAAEISAAIRPEDRLLALDRVLANLDKSQIIPKNIEGVKAEPPPIFVSKTPAVLVNVDGDPIWSGIQGNDLQFAVNTNWDLFLHTPTQTLYLRATDTWLKAPALPGPWTYAGLLPDSFYKLPNDANWKDAKGALPGKKIAPSDAPTVFATTAPAELILLKGKPAYAPVAGTTSLLWVSNTESDVFRVTRTGLVYFLVAGRWFSAPDFGGPWTFASLSLPDDFKKIPLEHPRSRVLASVPGTPEAAEAVLLAQIPETASVATDLQAPPVAYQGTPQFQPIEKTTVERAVNTDKDILKVGDLYYMCFQGVWFMSRTPTGPWEVTGDVPEGIYTIPVSSPSYSVTYVTVQSSTPTTVVYVASPAYSGVMVAWGCAVWGTGYYYPAVRLPRGLPGVLPALSHLRLRRGVQPLDGRVHARGGGLRSVRRRGRCGPIQPDDGRVLARRSGLRSIRRSRGRASLQPAHRRLRSDRARRECLRQLGLDERPAGRSVGHDAADDQQGLRRDDAHHAVERGLVCESHWPRRQHVCGRQER